MSRQTFEPFQQVIVRINDTWHGEFFSHMDEDGMYALCGGGAYTSENILPYKGNEHLLGTTDEPWQPKEDELVAVSNGKHLPWLARRFKEMSGDSFICYHEKYAEYESWRLCEPLHNHFNVPEK